jgi:methionyl-tRNA synthetase
MLKAMNLPLPRTVFAHGWWLVGRDKMSKSSGNVVNPMDIAVRYGVDAFRYFLMAEMSMGQDASFTEEAFVRRYNADLANDLGNMLSRIMKLIGSHCGGLIPAPGSLGEAEAELRDTALAAVREMMKSVEAMKLDAGLAGLAGVIRCGNRYLERQQPWLLAKQGKLPQLQTVLYCAAEMLRIVSGILHPVMPGKMTELRAALGIPDDKPDLDSLQEWGRLKPGAAVRDIGSLFPRIREAVGESAPAATDAAIEYDDFSRIALRSARILSARPVEGADKLLCLQIEIGSETRQIVAGIAKHYKPEDLVGRTIVVVANLKPATIRGVESKGMLLAASGGDRLRLVTLDGDLPTGSIIK